MEENKQHIDELFRESLGNYTETPPPAVWDAIELRLGGEKRRPAGGYMRWWGWLALLLLAVGGGALVMNQYKKSHEKVTALNTTTPSASLQKATAPVSPSQDSSKASTDATQTAANANEPVQTAATSSGNDNTPHHSSHRQARPGHSAQHVASNTRRPAHRNAVAPASNGAVADGHSNTTAAAVVAARRRSTHHSKPTRTATTDNVAQQTAGTGNTEQPAAAAVSKPAAAPQKVAHRPRRRQAVVTAAPKPVSNWQNNQPKTAVLPEADGPAVTKNNIGNKPAKRPAKHRAAAIAPPAVSKPAMKPKAAAQVAAPIVVNKPPPAPKRRRPVTAPPLRQPAVVAAPPAVPVAKAPKAPARIRTPRPIVPAPAAVAKNNRQPHAARMRPVANRTARAASAAHRNAGSANNNTARSNSHTAKPDNNTGAVITTNTSSTGQPASLEGKNQDVRFPSARPGADVPATPKPAATAPDVSGNPIGAEDDDSTGTGGGDTPYTMNSHRRHADGLGFSAGLAAGYSFGLSKPAAGEAVITPYLQYKLSDRLALRLSPSYRFGTVATQQDANGIYFKNSPTTVQLFDMVIQDSIPPPVHFDTLRNYYLGQQYDSIRTSSGYGGHTWAVDLPVTLAYRLGAGFSLFGGPVFSYQNTISGTGSQQIFTIQRRDTITTLNTPLLDTNLLKENFTHRGTPYSSYTGGSYAGSAAFRIGYVAGLQYQYRRVQAELSIQQNLTGLSNISNAAIKNIYSQPYFRFTIGYSLWEPRRKKVETP